MFGDNSRAVQINTVPSGATVLVNNTETNLSTPTAVIIPSMWSTTTIHVQKTGYKPQTVVIDPIYQPVGLWDIISPFFIGFLVTQHLCRNVQGIAG